MELIALTLTILVLITLLTITIIKNIKKIKVALKHIERFKPHIDKHVDARFSAYEELIKKVELELPINETFLKDVVQLRTDAHAARIKKNWLIEFTCESKISLVSENLNKILSDYSELKGNKEIIRAIKRIREQEDDLKDVILKYNILLDEYHYLIYGFPGSLIVKFNKNLYRALPYNR